MFVVEIEPWTDQEAKQEVTCLACHEAFKAGNNETKHILR